MILPDAVAAPVVASLHWPSRTGRFQGSAGQASNESLLAAASPGPQRNSHQCHFRTRATKKNIKALREREREYHSEVKNNATNVIREKL